MFILQIVYLVIHTAKAVCMAKIGFLFENSKEKTFYIIF